MNGRERKGNQADRRLGKAQQGSMGHPNAGADVKVVKSLPDTIIELN